MRSKREIISSYNRQTERIETLLLQLTLLSLVGEGDHDDRLLLLDMIQNLPEIINLSMNKVTKEKLQAKFVIDGKVNMEELKTFLISLVPYEGFLDEKGEVTTSSGAYK